MWAAWGAMTAARDADEDAEEAGEAALLEAASARLAEAEARMEGLRREAKADAEGECG